MSGVIASPKSTEGGELVYSPLEVRVWKCETVKLLWLYAVSQPRRCGSRRGDYQMLLRGVKRRNCEGEGRKGEVRLTHPPSLLHVRKEFSVGDGVPGAQSRRALQQPSQATEFEECQKGGRVMQCYLKMYRQNGQHNLYKKEHTLCKKMSTQIQIKVV